MYKSVLSTAGATTASDLPLTLKQTDRSAPTGSPMFNERVWFQIYEESNGINESDRKSNLTKAHPFPDIAMTDSDVATEEPNQHVADPGFWTTFTSAFPLAFCIRSNL
jgi:hypothetical protein